MSKVYTETVDNCEVVGVLFNPQDGRFYEFQDPKSHDHFELLKCPRSGETIINRSRIEQMMGEIINGYVKATVPIDNWLEFREMYLEADKGDFDGWSDKWREMAANDPRF